MRTARHADRARGARESALANAPRGVESVAIFHGPHAYVSPSWYEHPERMVPTWNYAAVHAHGALELIDDAVETRRVLDALVQRFEHARDAPWQFRMAERQRDAMVGAIVAFRMRIKRIEGKFKLSQNRGAGRHRARVTQGLRADGYAGGRGHGANGWSGTCSGRRPTMKRDDAAAPAARVRFDKWLWAARFYKTRSLAAQAIDAGQARVGGERVKPAHAVRTGDRVSVRKAGYVWDVDGDGAVRPARRRAGGRAALPRRRSEHRRARGACWQRQAARGGVAALLRAVPPSGSAASSKTS